MITDDIMDISECPLSYVMVNLDPESEINNTMCSPFTYFVAI